MVSSELVPGVHLHIRTETKFRTQILCVTFLWPMKREMRAASFLLSHLLSDTTLHYPRKQDLLAHLDNLYGASLHVINTPRGTCDRLKFTVSGVHVPGINDDLAEQLAELLKECIFFPRLEQGAFPQAMFEECRDQAAMTVRLARDDPQTRCMEAAAEHYGGSMALRSLPQAEEIEALSSDACIRAWNDIREHARIDIQVLSDLSEREADSLCRRVFLFAPRTADVTLTSFKPGHNDSVIQEKDIPQSHIVMLLESGILFGDPMYSAYILGNGIFGGLPVSLLFQNVREAQGLCYSIESGLLRYDGVLRVATAVEGEHIDETIESILQQLDVMQRGAFSEEDLAIARRMYVNIHRSSMDDPSAILSSDYSRILVPQAFSQKEIIAQFETMKKEAVAEAFSKLQLKTVSIVRQSS